MSDSKKSGFQRVFKEADILDVLSNESSEIRTSTLLKRLGAIDSNYKDRTHRGLAITLNKMAKNELVQKINREDDKADYWKITEAGIKARDTEKED